MNRIDGKAVRLFGEDQKNAMSRMHEDLEKEAAAWKHFSDFKLALAIGQGNNTW